MLFDIKGLKARVCCRKIDAQWIHLTNAVHCFIESEPNGSGDSTSWGLHGDFDFPDPEPSGEGRVYPDHSYDDPKESKCGPWTDNCMIDQCVNDVTADYPQPSEYVAFGGSNSNTYAGTVARECGLKRPDYGWPHGWDRKPAGPPIPFDILDL